MALTQKERNNLHQFLEDMIENYDEGMEGRVRTGEETIRSVTALDSVEYVQKEAFIKFEYTELVSKEEDK
ncbi:hypothetical protein KJB52_10810 [Staphylococcus chromogenes]|uniref:hypothetical protein n=1 Tax=Staphylococcus chromogenes TaxID=46126 RepID=UPI001F265C25|nr:hypothetical protein [Staphylococcus chromogenes]MCE5093405.1 hypothetical protein [Staphylococcus chromogenes]